MYTHQKKNRNIPTDKSYPAFEEDHINRFLSSARDNKSHDEQKHVFFSVDPAAGGDRSKYAMTSCIFQYGEMIVSFFSLLSHIQTLGLLKFSTIISS